MERFNGCFMANMESLDIKDFETTRVYENWHYGSSERPQTLLCEKESLREIFSIGNHGGIWEAPGGNPSTHLEAILEGIWRQLRDILEDSGRLEATERHLGGAS